MRTAAILAVTIPTTREISYPPPLPGAGSRTRSIFGRVLADHADAP
jgi:hypothetical protein